MNVDDLRKMCQLLESLNGPRIDENTRLYASLNTLAEHCDEISMLERKTGKDVLWHELLDNILGDGEILLFNPQEKCFRPTELKFNFTNPYEDHLHLNHVNPFVNPFIQRMIVTTDGF